MIGRKKKYPNIRHGNDIIWQEEKQVPGTKTKVIYIKEFSTEDQDNQPSLCAFQRDLSEPQHIAYALQQPCNWSFKNEAKVSVIAFF